ncbi:MAG: type II toxin-antitoxin system HicA family toxin [Bacteroidales bacterium]|nr:type II toxin-antitoxin system HicA family toxin [Bacteroidales bacterium]
MKTSELIKLLSKSGCYIVRHGSNHDIWYSPITRIMFPIPRHGSREIPRKTLNSIKRQAGL